MLFCAGSLTALFTPLAITAFCGALAVLYLIAVWCLNGRSVPAAGWWLAGLIIANGHFFIAEHERIRKAHTRVLSGCIVSEVTGETGVRKFDFAAPGSSLWPGTIRYRVSWYTPAAEVDAGSCWQLALRLKPPRGSLNAVGPDYERWLFAHGIAGIATVKNLPFNRKLETRTLTARLVKWRVQVHRRLEVILTGHRSAPLLSALAVGVRTNLDASYWDVLIKTGTAHLMAISGLHVGLAAMLGFFAGRYLPLRLRPDVNLVERGRILALISALVYAALAGFAISTVRALIMLMIWFAVRRGRVAISAWSALLLTVVILLLLNPVTAAGHGLWLSAGAVAVIIAASGTAGSHSGTVASVSLACRVQIMLMLLLVPLAGAIAGGVSWIAAPINLVLVPMFSIIVVPGVLLGLLLWLPAPLLSGVAFKALATFLDGVWHVLEIVAAWKLGFIPLVSVSAWSLLLFVIVGAMLLLPRVFPARYLSLILLAPIFFARSDRLGYGEIRLDVMDVGQALAIVVQTQTRVLVYDTGNAWPGSDSAITVLLPYLRSRNVQRVDDLVVSHADRDHAGGAHSLVSAVETGRVWAGEPFADTPHAQPCHRGQTWHYDGFRFAFLHPDDDEISEGNERSCVLSITGPAGRILLTGDLGQHNERRLLRYPEALDIDVVVGGHHGSLSSSDPQFIAAIDAGFVVFSNGYGNQWGMPRAQVVERWQAQGTTVMTTATSGQIRFCGTAGNGLRLCWEARQQVAGRWRWRRD